MKSLLSRPRLCAGHAALDWRFADIMDIMRRVDVHDLGAAWAGFARDLAMLMDYEEREIFDDYRRESPAHAATVAELSRDHARLRERLGQLGAEIQAGVVRSETVADFIACLSAHCQREDATVYPWLHQRRGQHRGRPVGATRTRLGAAG